MTARFVLDDLLAKLSGLLHRASVKACSNSHAEDLTTSCSKQQSPSRDPNVGVTVGSRVRRSYQLSSATKAPPGSTGSDSHRSSVPASRNPVLLICARCSGGAFAPRSMHRRPGYPVHSSLYVQWQNTHAHKPPLRQCASLTNSGPSSGGWTAG